METIEVAESEKQVAIEKAKQALEKGPILLKGIDRNSVIAVDVAEALKTENYKVIDIKLETEEKKDGEKTRRISVILIQMEK